MARVLETILLGTDRLTPALTKAAASVKAYDASVVASAGTTTAAEGKATDAVVTGSAKQRVAKKQALDSTVALANAEQASAAAIVSANSKVSGAVAGTTATYRRSAAELREKLGLEALDASAAERSAAANSRAAQSAAVFAASTAGLNTELRAETATLTANSASTRANTAAREQATVAARAQQAAVNSLSAANGLLGTNLSPLTAGLGATALGFGYAAFRGAQFDSAMSRVQAATMASSGTMDQLRESAIQLGADTQYSAEEAADGVTELAKAGVDTADILNGGLAGALDLAAAGQLGVADAAEIAATQMVVFNLQGNQMSHVADLLAAGAGKAQGSVQDMALALQYAGLPAAGLGLSIEETTGALGLFASNGLVGEKAGTSFRGMLVSLTNPAANAKQTMLDLNLEFFDAQGNFIGMEGVAGQLQSRLSGLSVEQRNAALAQIFGNEALGAAQALYNGGAAGVAQWTRNVNDAGYAAEQAAMLNDNLAGDLEKMGGAFDAAMTSVGGGTQGPLRLLVQTLTSLIDTGGDFIGFIQEIPGPLQAAAIAFAAVYIAAGPLGNLFPTIIGSVKGLAGIVSYQATAAGGAMGLFTGTVAAARVAVASLLTTLAPFAVVAVAVGAIARLVEVSNAADDAREHIDQLTQSYDDGRGPERYGALAGALDQVEGAAADARKRLDELENMSSWDAFWTWDHAGDIDIATEQLQAAQEAMAELDEASARADTSIGVLARRYGATRPQVEEFARAHGIDLSGSLQIVQGDFIRVADAAGGIEGALNQAGNGVAFIGDTAAMTQEQIDDAIERLQDWREELQDFATSFFAPLDAYKNLLSQKEEAERATAQATADATADSSDSWEDYVQDVTVSLNDLAAQLEQQIANQQNWQTNLVTVAQRGGLEVAQALSAMGVEGADITAAMATATEEDFVRMANALRTQAQLGGQDAVANLDTQMRIMSEVGAQGGAATAQSIATALGLGVEQVAAVAAQYGVTLAQGVNPILTALSKPTVQVGNFTARPGVNVMRAEGGPVWGAGTATSDSIPAMLSNGEYVIRASSVARYGLAALDAVNNGRAAGIAHFANGGFATAADVPQVSAVPFGVPLGTAATGTMDLGRQTVLAWMAANAETSAGATTGGPAGANAIGGGWQVIAKIVQAAIPQARINSTYRPGDPGYHGRGKAVDFGFGSGPGGAGSAGLASIARLLYTGYGRTLAELIYDGIGDDTPDVKNGRDHSYNAGTQREHRNHVHAAVYANGGLVQPGGLLNPHVRDQGGDLLPGYTFNGLGRPETVVAGPAASMPGYGTTFAPSFTVIAEFGSETMTATAVRVVDGRLSDLARAKGRT